MQPVHCGRREKKEGEGRRRENGERRQEKKDEDWRRREKGESGRKKTKCTLEKEADGRRGKQAEGRRDAGDKRKWMKGWRDGGKEK